VVDHFVNIGEIVDHHWLNCSRYNCSYMIDSSIQNNLHLEKCI